MIIKEFFEGPVGDYCIARNTIKCLLKMLWASESHLPFHCLEINFEIILACHAIPQPLKGPRQKPR